MGNRRVGALAVATVLVMALAGCSDASDTTTPPADPCQHWEVSTLATGLGAIENVLRDSDSALLLSVADAGEVRRFDLESKTVNTVIDDVASPGGLARRGRWAYVTTGLTIDAALQGTPTGTIVRFDPTSGRHETWASGLVAPNGLAILDDGSAIATRTLAGQGGTQSLVTRVPGDDPDALEPRWSDLTGTNGAAADPGGDWLYVSRVDERAEVWRLDVDDPGKREKVADLGVGTAELLDDLTVTDDGIVYVAAFVSGKVYRVDPATGRSCAVAEGLEQVSAVELDSGGDRLFVTSHDGTLYELTSP